MIKVVTGADVLTSARAGLGLPSDGGTNDIYIAASLRRLAGFLCPSSPRTLLRTMVETHRGLVADGASFAERVENIIEALIAMGDLLELSDVATLEETVRGTWVFAAPPAFVSRPSGSVFLIGLSADEATPLPADLRQRVSYQGIARWLEPGPDEDLAATLRDLGLNEFSLERWSRPPRAQSAAGLIAEMDGKLAAQTPCGAIADLRVLDHTRNVRRYRDRWMVPVAQHGRFIVRRPQAYGADLWGYAELVEGLPVKLLDLPLPASRWRGCDSAWRLQMAIDAEAGKAQTYVLHDQSDVARLEFFAPIPDWARRRLAAIGQEVAPSGCLLAYILSKKEVAAEEEFLQNYLFLRLAGA